MQVLLGTNRAELFAKIRDFLSDEVSDFQTFPLDETFIEQIYRVKPEIIIFDTYKFSKFLQNLIRTIMTAPSIRDIPLIFIIKKRNFHLLNQICEFGIFDYLVEPFIKCEFMMKINKAKEVIEIKRKFNEVLVKDYLTEAYNRRFLIKKIEEEMNWCNIYKEPLSLAILDIDHFKRINDIFGHLTGDMVLRELVNLCLKNLPDKIVVGRYGGEEFCLVMPSTNSQEAITLCENLRCYIKEAVFHTISGEELKITISIGLTTYSSEYKFSFDELIKKADSALYKAKQTGRNRVIFEPFIVE